MLSHSLEVCPRWWHRSCPPGSTSPVAGRLRCGCCRGTKHDTGTSGDVTLNMDRDRLATAEAAAYCGFRTARGLLSAYRRGKVYPVGRRGSSGSFTWRREDLDAFLRGEEPMGAALALRDSADVRPGDLAAEGRRLLGSGSSDGPPHRPAGSVRARPPRRERDDLGRHQGPGSSFDTRVASASRGRSGRCRAGASTRRRCSRQRLLREGSRRRRAAREGASRTRASREAARTRC
jgi:hypothetical protein